MEITPQEMLEAVKKAQPLTPKQKAIAQETMKKLRNLSSQEMMELMEEED